MKGGKSWVWIMVIGLVVLNEAVYGVGIGSVVEVDGGSDDGYGLKTVPVGVPVEEESFHLRKKRASTEPLGGGKSKAALGTGEKDLKKDQQQEGTKPVLSVPGPDGNSTRNAGESNNNVIAAGVGKQIKSTESKEITSDPPREKFVLHSRVPDEGVGK